jgi:hypothetical protein
MSMARIRTIKPEFFTSADICDLEPVSRLFYISLWCEADREGLLEWKPKTFKLRYFPADDKADFERAVSQLLNSDLINIYEIDGKSYCEIPTFKEHQVINNRESESIIPKKEQKSEETKENVDASKEEFTRESGVKAEGRKEGKEGKGKERNTRSTRKTNLPPDFEITQQMKDFYQSKNYPMPIDNATEQWLIYIRSSGAKYVDWYAAWQGGMAKQNEWFLRDNPTAKVIRMTDGISNSLLESLAP